MPDFEEIKQNFEPTDITAEFIILFKDEIDSIEGWIALEETLNDFKSRIQEEIEYYWGKDDADIKDYSIFYLDIEEKNTLKEVNTDEFYQTFKKLEKIFIVILHKDVKYRIIENLPPVFEWFMDQSF